MRKSFPELARNHVQQVETNNLERLTLNIKSQEAVVKKLEQKAKSKRDGGCGCFQCRKKHRIALEKLEGLKNAYQDEFNRMYKGDLE